MKNKFNKSPSSGKKPSTNAAVAAPASSEGKEMRSWVSVSDKVTKKDMEKVDVSRDKSDGLNL